MGSTTSSQGRRFPELGIVLLLPLLYYLGARFGSVYTVMPEGLAVIWPPNSAVLAALILTGGRRPGLVAFLVIGAEIAADVPTLPISQALLYSVVNLTEAWIAYALLRRWRFDRRFATIGDVRTFVVAGPLIGALSAALAGSALYATFFGIQTSYLEFVRIWWFGDGLGLMIFTPLLLGFWTQAGESLGSPMSIRRLDLGVLLAALLALALLIASQQGMLFGLHVGPVMLLPFIISMAACFALRWVAAAVAVVALVTVVMITHGNSPFGGQPGYETVVQAQEFIFITSLLGLGFSALLSQLSAKQREVETVNRHLQELNRDLEVRIAERTDELSVLNTQLAHQAQTDSLTGVLNRRGFMELARRHFEHSRRYSRSLAVMILDIDHFKSVNDRYGHHAGDLVLQQIATLLAGAIRPSDILARYGGEEFVILAPEADFEQAAALGARLLHILRGAAVTHEQECISVTASLGMTAWQDGQEDIDQLLRRADEGLYLAKADGRNRLVGVLPNRPPHVVLVMGGAHNPGSAAGYTAEPG